MINMARLHPARVMRSARRRLLALADRHRRAAPEDPADIVRNTVERLKGRVELPRFSVTFSDRQIYRRDATYHRDGKGFVLELPTAERRQSTINKAWELGPAYLYWLTLCPPEVEALSVTLSDGDSPSAARFSPSTNQSHIVPIPDPYFFIHSGFEYFRRLTKANPVAWGERSGEVVWRGASSGLGTFDPVLGAERPALAAQRLELILAARRLPGVDVALANYRRDEFRGQMLVEAGIVKPEIDESSWALRKYAIDVDGQTNTWSNLFVRLLLGCCVLKLDSKFGFRQWYYDRLKPWEHYVPVKADASDLGEKIEWVRANDARAADIAANGQRFATAMTYAAGRREAVALIERHWRG